MPVRALRPKNAIAASSRGAPLKTMNARKGIKTYQEGHERGIEIRLKTMNARKGIKTEALKEFISARELQG